MFENVVVGVDGRSGGRDAIALATRLITAGGKLTLVNVHAHDLYRVSGQQPRFDEILGRVSSELLERECSATGVTGGIASTGASSVAAGLHHLAQEHSADLLVVGSCRRAGVGRVVLGSDTKDALRDSPCAVAVAPRDYAEHPQPIRSVGVGYDGEPEGEAAMVTARALAAERNVPVHLLYAVSPVAPAFASMAPVSNGELIEQLLLQGRERLARVADADGEAVLGMPGDMLTDFSKDVDLLILGSCVRGSVSRALLGSTGEYVAQHGHCPVLLVARSVAPQLAPTGGTP